MMSLRRLRRSLAFRIVLPLGAALIAVFSLAALVLGRTVRSEGLRELRQRGQLLTDMLAYNAELPLLAGDTTSLSALLAGAARDPDLLQAAVFDADGRALATFSPSGRVGVMTAVEGAPVLILEGAVSTSAESEAGHEASAFALEPGAKTEGQILGHVRLLVSSERTLARTRRMHAQIATAGLGLLLVCAGIGLAVVRVLGRPLQKLVEATRRVAAGDLAVRVELSSSDEVGELADAFNRMAADLEVARAEVLAERAELERRVALRTSELERAQETLIHTEKMSAVGQLVAGVAHELNNPLTVVLGYSSLMLERISDPALRRKLESLHHAAESSRKIVQNLLAFARKQKVEKSLTDVNEVIERTVELRAYHLRSESIEVRYELQRDVPRTWADQHQLQQVVLNLVVNAEHAIQDSGKGGTLRFTTRRVAGTIEIEFEDDGPGIPTEIRTRIFEPFFTTKGVGRGTGLGLSICYGIIADHGGSIQVESEMGRWTRFLISLPLQEAPVVGRSGGAVPAASLTAPGAANLRILVIDDDPGVLRFVEDAFDGEPVVVDKALGGRDAISSLSTGRIYDAILSDLRMPEFDGRDVHSFVREHRPELASRLILATGDMANLDSLKFMDDAGCLILEKPFTVAALRAAVQRVSRR